MPTLKELTDALMKADQAGDTEGARILAQAIEAHPEFKEPEPLEDEPKKPGILSRIGSGIKEAFTGEKRKTTSTDAAQPLIDMPEIKNDTFATFASLFNTDDELAKIMKIRYPDLKTRKDEKGNMIFISADGSEFTNKPGASRSDLPMLVANTLAFAKVGKAGSLPKRMRAAGFTQAAIESMQAQMGGDADLEQVALAAAGEPLSDVVGYPIKKAVEKGKPIVSNLFKQAPTDTAIDAATRTAPESAADLLPDPARLPEPTAELPAAPDLPDDATPEEIAANFGLQEFGKRIRQASTSKTKSGQQKAISDIAAEVRPDVSVVEAAADENLLPYLQPDHITSNQSYREMAAAIKSLPTSKAKQQQYEAMQKVSERGVEIIKELGGTEDVSALDREIFDQFDETVETMAEEADTLWEDLKKKVGEGSEIEAENVLDFIDERAAKRRDGIKSLSPTEKLIHKRLRPEIIKDEAGNVVEVTRPTYADLDDIRKDVVQSIERKTGPFRNADVGLLNQLETLLLNDQKTASAERGAEGLFAVARESVAVRKGLEKDFQSIYGRAIDKSLVQPLTTGIKKLEDGDVSGFVKVIKSLKSLPEDRKKQVTATGIGLALRKNATSGMIDFKGFADWYNGVKTQRQAYAALMSNLDDDAAKRLKNLAKLSEAINKTSQQFISTGRLTEARRALEGADDLAYKVYDQATKATKKVIAGAAATAVTGSPVGGVIGAAAQTMLEGKTNILTAADDLISSPAFLDAVRTSGEKQLAEIKKLANSKQFKTYYDLIKAEQPEIEDPAMWIRGAIQAAKPKQEDE